MRSFSNVGALALAFASTSFAAYVLEDDYSGADFFDGFDFITTDPTLGYVDYLTHDLAKGTNGDDYLINYNSTTGTTYIGVDYWSTLDPAGTGRASVRIESTKTYQYGLFIIDLVHMPTNQDGLWPAFWTASHIDYPGQGEIDILENIHAATVSRQALHTFPGCVVSANKVVKQQTGNQLSYACDDISLSSKYGKQYVNEGCVAEATDATTYGDGFNKAGGGVYATEWTSDAITVWFFAAGNVPSDITKGAPVPSSKWGKPSFTTANGDCVIDDFFKDHHIILNTDFCGTWAGKDDVWQSTDSYDAKKYPTCASYVAANPKLYKDAYWDINSIKVYSNSSLGSSSSSTSASSTSSLAFSSTKPVVITSSPSSLSPSKISSTSTPIASSALFSKSNSPLPTATSTISVQSTSSVKSSSTPSQTTNIIFSSFVYSSPSSTDSTTSASTSASPTEVFPITVSSAGSLTFISSTQTISEINLPEFTPVTFLSISHTSAPNAIISSSIQSPQESVTASSSLTTSTIFATSVYTITSCAATITNCPAKLGSVTTEIIAISTTICPFKTSHESKRASSRTKKSKSCSSLTTSMPVYTTSTVYATNTKTITSCTASVTDCPVGKVVTETVALYTTVCPVAAAVPTSTKGVLATGSSKFVKVPLKTASSSLSPPKSSLGDISSQSITSPLFTTISFETPIPTPSSKSPVLTTSTVYGTSVYTITSCAPTVTNCPAKIGQVTTEVVKLYTTICPVEESQTSAGVPGSTSLAMSTPTELTTSASILVPSTQNSSQSTATILSPAENSQGASPSISAAPTSVQIETAHSTGLLTSHSQITRTQTTIRTISASTAQSTPIPIGSPSLASTTSSTSNIISFSPTTLSSLKTTTTPSPSALSESSTPLLFDTGSPTRSSVRATSTSTTSSPVFEGAASALDVRGYVIMSVVVVVGAGAVLL